MNPFCLILSNHRWRRNSIARQYKVNEQIRASQVRVIGEASEQLGVMSLAQALQMARDNDVDLVEVAPNADPPVTRLLDYGKLRYLTAKKERESKKSQKNTELREVRFRPNIGQHDLDAKLRKVREFIDDGSKVKLTVRFRGREAVHQQLGLSLLKRVADDLKDDVRLEKPPAMEGRALSMILIPSASTQKVEKGDTKVEDLADAKT
ncbi:MAG: translation initiation factor IF-3 [Dehalococcoidia bacterium]